MGFLPDVKHVLARVPKRKADIFFSATLRPPSSRSHEKCCATRCGSISTGKPRRPRDHALRVCRSRRASLSSSCWQRASGSVWMSRAPSTGPRARPSGAASPARGYGTTATAASRNARHVQQVKQGRFQVLVATDIAARIRRQGVRIRGQLRRAEPARATSTGSAERRGANSPGTRIRSSLPRKRRASAQ